MRRGVLWALQAGLAVVLAAFVSRALWANWAEFRALRLDLAFRIGPIAVAGLVTLGTYGLLIEAWRRVVGSWGDQLTYTEAGYIWTVSNLGRYIPGKIWTVAGLVVLARRAGVSGANATVSGLVMQVLAVGTGAAVMAAGISWNGSLWATAAAVALSVGAVAALVWRPVGARVIRLLSGGREARALPLAAVLLAGGATLASWLGHGLSFWLISRGVLVDATLELPMAIAAFAAAYVLGLLALFAPGGIGVREAVLATLLTPVIGAGGAVLLSVASRLFLTVMEVGVAMIAAAAQVLMRGNDGV
jgi:uncharacterized membrane protein YbhN (UPF0104 family)